MSSSQYLEGNNGNILSHLLLSCLFITILALLQNEQMRGQNMNKVLVKNTLLRAQIPHTPV